MIDLEYMEANVLNLTDVPIPKSATMTVNAQYLLRLLDPSTAHPDYLATRKELFHTQIAFSVILLITVGIVGFEIVLQQRRNRKISVIPEVNYDVVPIIKYEELQQECESLTKALAQMVSMAEISAASIEGQAGSTKRKGKGDDGCKSDWGSIPEWTDVRKRFSSSNSSVKSRQ